MCKCSIDFYKHRGFKISSVLGDNEFLYLEEYLDDKYDIEYNAPSTNEHIGEIEHMIRMVKECIPVIISGFPWY